MRYGFRGFPTPCEMCWKHSGELKEDTFTLCYACRTDVQKIVSFLISRNFVIISRDDQTVDPETGEILGSILTLEEDLQKGK